MEPVTIAQLKPAFGARKRSQRVGRGNGSRRGTTSGRGTKGQRARTGGGNGLKLKGLKRFVQQIPKKRGFRSRFVRPIPVTLGDLAVFADGATVSPRTLAAQGVVRSVPASVKILATGTLIKKLTVVGCFVTEGAKAKIEAAGGTVKM